MAELIWIPLCRHVRKGYSSRIISQRSLADAAGWNETAKHLDHGGTSSSLRMILPPEDFHCFYHTLLAEGRARWNAPKSHVNANDQAVMAKLAKQFPAASQR